MASSSGSDDDRSGNESNFSNLYDSDSDGESQDMEEPQGGGARPVPYRFEPIARDNIQALPLPNEPPAPDRLGNNNWYVTASQYILPVKVIVLNHIWI